MAQHAIFSLHRQHLLLTLQLSVRIAQRHFSGHFCLFPLTLHTSPVLSMTAFSRLPSMGSSCLHCGRGTGPGTAAHCLGSPTPSGCPGGCSRPTYPSPSSTHRQFTGGREFFFCIAYGQVSPAAACQDPGMMCAAAMCWCQPSGAANVPRPRRPAGPLDQHTYMRLSCLLPA
jgi:hypothetical protein